ncbi:hypothetical protein ACFW2V_12955 [Streptomyces sp. NPDC058947]|uniref:hypothetical protein n=1 Tax=Streptomyces sp. NPDC058947 TaxID=3346675 RepID=UPI0036B6E133
MTQDTTTAPGSPEPGPDNFDFEAWLEKKSTFPVFKHTAYVDQKSGAELSKVYDEIEELVAEQSTLEKRIEERSQQSSNSFVDAQLDRMLGDREELNERLEEAFKRRDELVEKIRESALTLHFQVKTSEELGSVSREAIREFHKENQQFKTASDDDLDYITARSRYMLTAQVAHFCTGMTLADGREVPPPTRQGAEKLLKTLIQSEMLRLMESVGTGLAASQEWASKLDAGFPGGGSDVAGERLDQNGTESGEVVGPSPSHDDHREALGLG